VHAHAGISFTTFLSGGYPYCQSVESLLYRMDANAVDYAVAFPLGACAYFDTPTFLSERLRVAGSPRLTPAPYVLENRILCEEVYEKTPSAPGRILPFVSVDPGRCVKTQLRALEALAEEYPIYGVKVVGVMVQSNHRHLAGKAADFTRFAEERNLPMLLHSTAYAGDAYCHSNVNLALARAFPGVRFCLAHCLGFDKPCLDEADALANVWVDSAAMKIQVEPDEILAPPERRFESDYAQFRQVFRDLASAYPDLMVWGSDSPAYTYIEKRRYPDGSYVSLNLQGTYELERAALDALPRAGRLRVANRNTRRFLFGG